MNGTEQRTHTRVTDELRTRIANVELVVSALHNQVLELAHTTATSVGDERTHRLQLADKQRAYVDGENRILCRSIELLQARTTILSQSTFWQRLKWLIRGL